MCSETVSLTKFFSELSISRPFRLKIYLGIMWCISYPGSGFKPLFSFTAQLINSSYLFLKKSFFVE